MDVTSRQFSSELVKILQLVADSHFVALDLEFSGIASRRARGDGSRLSLQQVYKQVREAAKQYQVLQVGLTIVEEDAQKGTSYSHCLVTDFELLRIDSTSVKHAYYFIVLDLHKKFADTYRCLCSTTLQLLHQPYSSKRGLFTDRASLVVSEWR
jgi:CAF1 family ribonuclease